MKLLLKKKGEKNSLKQIELLIYLYLDFFLEALYVCMDQT